MVFCVFVELCNYSHLNFRTFSLPQAPQPQRNFLLPFPLFMSSLRQPPIHPVSWIYLFWTCHRNGTIHYEVLRYWLLVLSITFSRFSCVIAEYVPLCWGWLGLGFLYLQTKGVARSWSPVWQIPKPSFFVSPGETKTWRVPESLTFLLQTVGLLSRRVTCLE